MYGYNLTEANADELIKICCALHVEAVEHEGLNEDGELWKLWKRLSDTLTDMWLLETEEPEEEAEEEWEEEWADEGDDTDWDDCRVIGGADFGDALDALENLSIIKG